MLIIKIDLITFLSNHYQRWCALRMSLVIVTASQSTKERNKICFYVLPNIIKYIFSPLIILI